ncbi:alpha/beta hydrolase [Pseudaestuariivita rosea]|uniref:alpha/beta hydrolase n=1 Tax=Pseudaestuariivita rosea TaxID=2763263 RepID=UPI001ABAA66B|nr:dienelactone hydrolase family protein [Pseudaestuariivita rosea]
MQHAGMASERASFGLVLIHGRGASADGMLQFGQSLGLPDVALVAPQAPGQSWWPTSFLAPMDQMSPYIHAGLAEVDKAIDSLQTAGLPRDRIAVAGFSQGACLALEYGARSGNGLAGIFGLSGGLIGMSDTGTPDSALYGFADKRFDYDTDLTGTQVYVSCHTQDPHIPLKRVQDTIDVMRSLGADVQSNTVPGTGHSIFEADVAAIRKQFNRVKS